MFYSLEKDAMSAADRIDMKTLREILRELPEDRLRDFIRATERAQSDAVEELQRRHGGAPYSGMGGLLAHETDDHD